MNIYALLFLFFGLYLSVCIWIFLVITDSVRKVSIRRLLRSKPEFVKEVDRHFTMLFEDKSVSEEAIVCLCRKLTNRKMKRYYLQRFVYYADRVEDKGCIKNYFRTAFPFFKDLLHFGTNMHYSEKSYRLMLLGEFRQDLQEVNEFILKAIDNESFDVRTNALRALSIIGNSSYFNKGLIKACKSDKYFNNRHISEMLGSFEGDIDELRQLMLNSFFDNQDPYRYQVLVFLTEYACCTSMNFVLAYLDNNPVEKELLIACLRYFKECEANDYAWGFIIKLLYEEDLEIRAVAVTLTPLYFKGDQDVIRFIAGEGYLKSKDWYVRRNSAFALVRICLEKEEMLQYLITDDKYAIEALVYAMFDSGIVTYEEFVELGGGLSGIDV